MHVVLSDGRKSKKRKQCSLNLEKARSVKRSNTMEDKASSSCLHNVLSLTNLDAACKYWQQRHKPYTFDLDTSIASDSVYVTKFCKELVSSTHSLGKLVHLFNLPIYL